MNPRLPPATALAVALLAVAVLVAAGPALPAAAQVNTESMRIGEERHGVSGFTELLLALKEGNTERLGLGGGFRIQHAVVDAAAPPGDESGELDQPVDVEDRADRSGPGEAAVDDSSFRTRRLIFWVAQGAFAEENGTTSEKNAFSHVRWVRRVAPRTKLEAFVQWEHDELQRLDARWLVGAGTRFALLEKQHRELFLGTAYMYEGEEIAEPEEGSPEAGRAPGGDDTRAHRLTSYLTAKLAGPSRNLLLLDTLYVQPNLEDPGDFRLLNETHLEVALTDRLALDLALVVRYDSEPPAGVEQTDLSLTNRFRYGF